MFHLKENLKGIFSFQLKKVNQRFYTHRDSRIGFLGQRVKIGEIAKKAVSQSFAITSKVVYPNKPKKWGYAKGRAPLPWSGLCPYFDEEYNVEGFTLLVVLALLTQAGYIAS